MNWFKTKVEVLRSQPSYSNVSWLTCLVQGILIQMLRQCLLIHQWLTRVCCPSIQTWVLEKLSISMSELGQKVHLDVTGHHPTGQGHGQEKTAKERGVCLLFSLIEIPFFCPGTPECQVLWHWQQQLPWSWHVQQYYQVPLYPAFREPSVGLPDLCETEANPFTRSISFVLTCVHAPTSPSVSSIDSIILKNLERYLC